MTDTVDTKTRSRIMSSVRNKSTNIEQAVRKALFAKGFRYKINDKTLPGSPDIVLPKYQAVIFVHGCFWHGHTCQHGSIPKSHQKFWRSKIENNMTRDKENITKLVKLNWRVAVVWECSIRGSSSPSFEKNINSIEAWLKGQSLQIEIPLVCQT